MTMKLFRRIRHNSWGKVFLKAKDQKKDINPLTSNELKLLLDTFSEHFPEHYTLVLLLARTGMRISEALGLKWGDIDYNGRFIEVKRSYVRGKISTPKSGKSRRVDMSLQLTKALKAHELESKKKGLALGLGDNAEYVFTNRSGQGDRSRAIGEAGSFKRHSKKPGCVKSEYTI